MAEIVWRPTPEAAAASNVGRFMAEHAAVVEAAAAGLPHELRTYVADRLGKSLRPNTVRFTGVLPKTRSNKVMRCTIRAVARGRPPGDLSGLEDPSSLDAIMEPR